MNCQLANSNEEDLPDDLIDKVLDLTYDYNFKTCITAMNIVLYLVAKFPKKIESKYGQI